MAQSINEAKRMQQLAGILTESQLNENIKDTKKPQEKKDNLEEIVDTVLEKLRNKEKTNEIFGLFGGPTLKVGDKLELEFDKPLAAMGQDRGYASKRIITVKFIGGGADNFEVTQYAFDSEDYAGYTIMGSKRIDKGDSQIAKMEFYQMPIIHPGRKVRLSTGKEGNKIEKGKQIQIGGSWGPKVVMMKLNGKEESKVSIPNK